MIKATHTKEEKKMNPIKTIYCLRLALGVTAGVTCAAVSKILETTIGLDGTSTILYSITLTLLIYLLSFRILKAKFQNKVETPSKITMTGIGIYFLAWVTFYILFYTIILAATHTIPETPPPVTEIADVIFIP
ncbi:MAG: hypothetical protein LBB87_05710 [Nitrososphaerota archaeon]|jgi:hypothetical protein|nr:hypothetical protein [Nitrososphaerota archaeon]